MAKFALLLHHAPDRYTGLDEDEFVGIMKDYIGWVQDAAAKGIYTGGHKLTASAGTEVTSGPNGVQVHDGPFAELPEVLGGLMIVEVDTLEDAVELAKNHPHLVHNSRIEIREIEDVS